MAHSSKPIKILTIVGARPQFIKAAMVSRAIVAHNRDKRQPEIIEAILHTGQHYDENMSDIFFTQMEIPEPAVNLHAGTGLHGEMTARMLARIEKEIIDRKPDWALVYGDTNSTLAGALAAAKLHVPVAHIEAGLRSFNKQMPEEINRILADHVSTLLLCPTHAAVANLAKEGITKGVHHVGDVMYDAALAFGKIAKNESTILSDLNIAPGSYLLATVHRAENTDDPDKLQNILAAFLKTPEPIVFPVHPRTRQKIADLTTYDFKAGFDAPVFEFQNITFIDPVSFLDMVQLEQNARCILTESGGVQKEAYFHGIPCVTLRKETEWVETVHAGWNQVVGTDTARICEAVRKAGQGTPIPEFGEGSASKAIVDILAGNER